MAAGAGGFADFAEAGAGEDVGWEAHVDDVEDVEELGAELEVDQFGAALARAEWGVFDEGEVEVVIGGSAEGVATEGAEAA